MKANRSIAVAVSRTAGGAALPSFAALGAWAVCVVWVAAAGSSALCGWLVIAVIPGLALAPFMPVAARRSAAMAVTAACIAAIGFWAIVIPWISLVGISINQVSVLGAAGAVCVACVALAPRFGANAVSSTPSTDLFDLLGLAITIVVAALVASSMSSTPPIGGDWGHYWLYADQIRIHGTLDATNQFWMGGGRPFGDYPGVPSLMAAWLLIAGRSAASTSWLIGLLFILLAAATWLTARIAWSSGAAALAGPLAAVMPATIAIIAWSGLATLLALVFVLPMMAIIAALPSASEKESIRLQVTLAVLAVAALIAQPIIAVIVLAGFALLAAFSLVTSRGSSAWPLARILLTTSLLGVPILLDFRSRLDALGNFQDFRAYLTTRMSWEAEITNGTLPAAVLALGLAGLLVALGSRASRPLAVVILATLAASLAYTQAWRLGISGEYRRIVYVIGPLAALGASGIATLKTNLTAPLRLLAAVVIVGGAALAVKDWPAAQRSYFGVVPAASWTTATRVASQVASDESIVTDSCWAFPALGTGKAKVFGALLPHQIGPSWEAAPAGLARKVFTGGRGGLAAANRINARWSFFDPTCPSPMAGISANGVPHGFIPVSASSNLIVGYRPHSK